jgi:hypothetical protein
MGLDSILKKVNDGDITGVQDELGAEIKGRIDARIQTMKTGEDQVDDEVEKDENENEDEPKDEE